MLYRVTAVVLVVALSLLGMPLPTHADGEEPTPRRVVTLRGPDTRQCDVRPSGLRRHWNLDGDLRYQRPPASQRRFEADHVQA